jgi:hypothetical protein
MTDKVTIDNDLFKILNDNELKIHGTNYKILNDKKEEIKLLIKFTNCQLNTIMSYKDRPGPCRVKFFSKDAVTTKVVKNTVKLISEALMEKINVKSDAWLNLSQSLRFKCDRPGDMYGKIMAIFENKYDDFREWPCDVCIGLESCIIEAFLRTKIQVGRSKSNYNLSYRLVEIGSVISVSYSDQLESSKKIAGYSGIHFTTNKSKNKSDKKKDVNMTIEI